MVPGLTRIPFAAKHPALLYAIGPEFGQPPDWLASDSLTRLHVARAQVQVLSEPDVWRAHLVLAEEARARSDLAAALEQYLAVTRGNPRLASAWVRIGDVLLELGRGDQAREAYERARRLEPANVEARIGIGWTQVRAQRPELAAQTWAPLVSDPATLRAMATVFERAGNTAALEAARRALGRAP